MTDTAGSGGQDRIPTTAATCDGYEWRGEVPWKCQRPPGHKAPDGTFLGRSCKGNDGSRGRDACPACGVSLIGDPIPQKWIDAGMYGDPNGEHLTHYRRDIGIYSATEDRTVAYRCPDCGAEWGR